MPDISTQTTSDSLEAAHDAHSTAPAMGKAVSDYFSADEIFHRVVATADEELNRAKRMLFLSAIGAGLSIGLSFIARAAVAAKLPADANDMIINLLYPVGFLFIVMGRYQLFTENTLTPVTLVLTRLASLPKLLVTWGVVLGGNILGAAMIAFALANTGIFNTETAAAARAFGEHALEVSWWDLFFKGVIAGWLVAGMVWIIHAARDSMTRFVTVFLIMYLVPVAELFHCIIGACEVLYLVFEGAATLTESTFEFFLPVLLGNTLGGVLLVAILNFAQTDELDFLEEEEGRQQLSWREWLLGSHSGRAEQSTTPIRPVLPDQDDSSTR